MRSRTFAAAAGLMSLSIAAADVASAACTTLSFSVNDYGKEGPSNDAKNLLDKYAAKWTSEHGIKKFNVGQKQVTCELFLNFVLFDEHTCTATASVCYDGADPTDGSGAKAATPLVNKAAGKAKVKAPTALTATAPTGAAVSTMTTGSVKPSAAATKAAPSAAKPAVAAPAAVMPAPVIPSAAPAATVMPSLPVVTPTAPVVAPVAPLPSAPSAASAAD